MLFGTGFNLLIAFCTSCASYPRQKLKHPWFLQHCQNKASQPLLKEGREHTSLLSCAWTGETQEDVCNDADVLRYFLPYRGHPQSHSSPRQQRSCEAHCWVGTWAVPSPVSTYASATFRSAPTRRLLTITEPQMPLQPHNCPSTY